MTATRQLIVLASGSIIHGFQVSNKVRARWHPIQAGLGPSARCQHVHCHEHRKPAEMFGGFLGRQRYNRHSQSSSSDFGDLTQANSLLCDCMVPGAGLVTLESEAIQPRSIVDMYRWPSIGSVTHIGRQALGSANLNERRDETLLLGIMHLGKANHRDRHALVRCLNACPLTCNARERMAPVDRLLHRRLTRLVLPMPVLEVMISGRSEPTSASAIAPMTRRSFSQFSAKREKS